MDLLERNPRNDALLLQWWLLLGTSGDLVPMFGPWAESAAAFLAEMTRPDLRMWVLREGDEWVAAEWSSPFMGGATFNFWIHPSYRGLRAVHLAMYDQCLSIAAETPVMIFVTRSERTLQIAQHMGFTASGVVPYLFHGDTAYIGYMTPADAEGLAQSSPFTPQKEAANG